MSLITTRVTSLDLVGTTYDHPVVEKFLLSESVTVVRDDDRVVTDLNFAIRRIGVVTVFDQLRQCNFRLADQSLT